MTFDVAVVGAGIVGAACAREFARAGRSVAVVEDKLPGGGATAAGMGHVVLMDDSEAQFALTRLSRELWNELAQELPANAEYVPCGTIWVAADEEEMREVARKRAFYAVRNVKTEVLDPRQLHEAEPELREGLAGALLVPDDSVVYPPCATQFLLEVANATMVSGRATRLRDGCVEMADGTRIHAGTIVNATGVHARKLMPDIPIAIEPRKGHLLITDRYPEFVRHQLVELGYLKSAHATTADSVAFNVQPRKSGQILIGSSRQFGTSDRAMDGQILSAMLERARQYMPGIGDLSAIRGWTGFRAATPDKLPLIGACPGYRNVFVAAGHEGLGITTSLGTARLLADFVLGRAAVIAMEPYLPERVCVLNG